MEVRYPLEPQARAELAAEEHHGVLERGERFGSFVVPPDDAHPDLGMAQVGRGLDLGDGGEADPGIGHLAFAGVALFVGSFVIANSLSITIAQRTREFATVRTLGGSRRQVLWSIVLGLVQIDLEQIEVVIGNCLQHLDV